MFGWESLAAVRPSRLKRAPISVPPCWELRILTATGRSKTSSLPRKTRAMPPVPISRSSTNLCANLVMRPIIAASRRVHELPRGKLLSTQKAPATLVLETVQFPLPILDDTYPGTRDYPRASRAVLPDHETGPCLFPHNLGLRVTGEVHIPERTQPLPLRPLLRGAHLLLQPPGEVRVRSLGVLIRLFHVHVKHRLGGLARGRHGFGGGRGLVWRGFGGGLHDFLLLFDGLPGLPSTRTQQRVRTRAEEGQQEQRGDPGGHRDPPANTRLEGLV